MRPSPMIPILIDASRFCALLPMISDEEAAPWSEATSPFIRLNRLALPVPAPDKLLLLTESLDAQPNTIARTQIHGGFQAHADARRSAGCDHVSWLEAHELAQVAHQECRSVDHGFRAAILEALSVYFEPHAQILRIRDLVPCHKPGAERAEGVGTLSLSPLSRALDLKG